MQSIALFPCSYTYEAGIIGELSNSLHLRVYTDEMLFSDIAEQFGVPVQKLKKILYRKTPELNRSKLEKEKYIDLVRCSLQARKNVSPDRCIFYGLHTSLLDTKRDRVLKVLVVDDEKCRMQRAVQQEGLSKEAARDLISQHDEKVMGWTEFLFNKEPYAKSLHDLVISCKNRDMLDITTEIIQRFHNFYYAFDPVQYSCDSPASEIPGTENSNHWRGSIFPENSP